MAELTDAQRRAIALAKARAKAVAGSRASGGVMPNVNRGIVDTVGGLVDLVNPFDQPHALNPFPEGTGSARAGLTNVMERSGIDVAEGRPQTVVEGLARGAGQAAGALVPATGAARALSAAGGMTGRIAGDAARSMSTPVGAAAEVAAGGASGAAEQGARQAGLPQWAQTTAAVAAPMALPAAGMAARTTGTALSRLPVASTVRNLNRAAVAAAAPYTKAGANEVAARRVVQLAGGPERAAELRDRVGGENPLNLTPAQQTGDENFLALEQLAASQDPRLRERLDIRREESRAAARREFEQPGDIQATREFFETRRREFANDLRARADDAIARTQQGIEGVAPVRTEAENSLQVSNRLNEALETATQQERRLWDAVPMGAQVPTSGARSTAAQIIEDTPRAQQNDIPNVLRTLLTDEGGFGDVETVREMHGLYSELRRVARSAMAGNDQNKNRARIANSVADAILRDMGAVDGTTDIGRQINEARAFSRALHETFDQGEVGRLMTRTLDGDQSVAPELALQRTVGRGGVAGMVGARDIEAAASGSEPFIRDYLKQRFQDAVTTPTGEFSMKSASQFLRQNRDLLDRYPSLRDDVRDALKERDNAEQFATRIEQRLSRLQDSRLSAGRAVLNGPPSAAIKAFTEARNPVQAARRIVNEARKDESGEALAGLKSLLAGELISRSNMTGRGMADALDNPKLRAGLRQVFDESEMSRMRIIARELAKVDLSEQAAPSIGSSLSGASTNEVIETIARIKAAQIGGAAGAGGNMGGSLQTANILSSRVRDVLGRLTADRASQLLNDAIEDGELLRFLLSNPASARMDREKLNLLLPYLIGGGAAAATED